MNELLDLEAYRRRLNLAAFPSLGVPGLTELIRAHLRELPFENLDVVLRRPMSLELGALQRKMLGARRGGFCYELNALFAALLRALGYQVEFMQGQVATGNGFTPPFAHICLKVELDRTYLVDVGYSRSPTEPMPLQAGAQIAANGYAHRLVAHEGGLLLQESEFGGPWTACYRFEEQPQPLAAFEKTFRFLSSPESVFARGPFVTRLTGTGWLRLQGGWLSETRELQKLDPVQVDALELKPALARFGLDHVEF